MTVKAFEEIQRSTDANRIRKLHYFSRVFRSAKRQGEGKRQFNAAAQAPETLQVGHD